MTFTIISLIVLMLSNSAFYLFVPFNNDETIKLDQTHYIKTSGTTWTVDDDGPADFTTIQDAVNNANPGDTIIVKDGIYTENIELNKANLIMKSENGALKTIIQATTLNDHIIEVTAEGFNISGFTIKGAGNNYAGILISDNLLYQSISYLNFSNNYYGIKFYSNRFSPRTLSKCQFLDNYIGVKCHSEVNERYGKVELDHCNFSKNEYGVHSEYWCGVDAKFCKFYYNSYGIYGYRKLSIGSDFSIFTNNTYAIHGENTWGLGVRNSTFSFNHIGCSGIGITSLESEGCIFQKNTFGISLKQMYDDGDPDAIIVRNTNFTENGWGLYINNYAGVENEVINCSFSKNYNVGIDIASSSSSHTQIYLNNFIDNNIDVDTHSSGPYVFNTPNPKFYAYNGKQFENYLGNYWSDYFGVDEFNGPNQDLSGSDGIGDTPYIIDSSNQDQYPLMMHFEVYFQKKVNTPPGSFILTSNAFTPDTDGDYNLTWSESYETNNYSIYTSSSFINTISEAVLLQDGITDLNYTITGKMSDEFYYMVVAFNNNGNTTSNCILVDVKIPPEPFSLTVDPASPVYSGDFNLTWSKSNGADNYTVFESDSFISEIDRSQTLIQQDITELNWSISTYKGVWYYIVVAYNETGNITSNCISVDVRIPPGYFSLNSDADPVDTDGSYTLQWDQPLGYDNYSVYVSDKIITIIDTDCSELVGGFAGQTFPITNRPTDEYYYVVIAFNKFGNTSTNNIHITVHRLPSTFSFTSEAETPDPNGEFYLNWTSSTDGDNYTIYMYSNFISEINDSLDLIGYGLTNFSYWISGLSSGEYYFIAIANNTVGQTLSNCIIVKVSIPLNIGDGGGSSGGSSSNGGETIPFGNYYIIFTLLSVAILIVLINRKLALKKKNTGRPFAK